MLLIIDCKKKITWKKLDHINGSVLSSDGKIASEEKELLKVAENGEVDKVMDEVVDELLVSINNVAMITYSKFSACLSPFYWLLHLSGLSLILLILKFCVIW